MRSLIRATSAPVRQWAARVSADVTAPFATQARYMMTGQGDPVAGWPEEQVAASQEMSVTRPPYPPVSHLNPNSGQRHGYSGGGGGGGGSHGGGPEGSSWRDAVGPLMGVAGFATFMYMLYRAQEEGQEGPITGPRMKSGPGTFVYDYEDLEDLGDKPSGRLSGRTVKSSEKQPDGSTKEVEWVEKGGCTHRRVAREFIVASLLDAIYKGVGDEELGTTYPSAALCQKGVSGPDDQTVRFFSMSEVLPGSMDLEKFLDRPDMDKVLAQKPLKGLGVAIACDRMLGKQDIKMANMVVQDMGDHFRVFSIDHEDVCFYQGHLQNLGKRAEPRAETLGFMLEYNPHNIGNFMLLRDQKPELAAAVREHLEASIQEDVEKGRIQKAYHAFTDLNYGRLFAPLEPLRDFIPKAIGSIEQRMTDRQGMVGRRLFEYERHDADLDGRTHYPWRGGAHLYRARDEGKTGLGI